METGTPNLTDYMIGIYADGDHILNIPFDNDHSAHIGFELLKTRVQLNEKFLKADMVLWKRKPGEDFPRKMIRIHVLRKEEV